MVRLEGVSSVLRAQDFLFSDSERQYIESVRPRKRLTELMEEQSKVDLRTRSYLRLISQQNPSQSLSRSWELVFRSRPTRILPHACDPQVVVCRVVGLLI
jgi:hypothetical protein